MPTAAHRATAPGSGPRVPTRLVLGVVIVGLLAGGIATAVARDDGSGSNTPASATPASPTGGPSGRPTPAPGASSTPPTASTTASTPTSTPPSSPQTCPAPGPGAFDASADLFTPPSTWSRVPDATAGTGPVDINKAASLDGGGGLSAVGLRQLCFLRGITRQWQDNGVILVDLVYTFGTAQGAQAFAATTVSARVKDPAFTAVDPGRGAPAGSHAFTTNSAGSLSRVVVFVEGAQAAILGLVQDGTPPDPAALASFAAAQAQVSAHTSRS